LKTIYGLANSVDWRPRQARESLGKLKRVASQSNLVQYVLADRNWDDEHENIQERLFWALLIWKRAVYIPPVSGETEYRLMQLILELDNYYPGDNPEVQKIRRIMAALDQRAGKPAPRGVRRSEPPSSGALSCSTG
jgi:hypothetical protein